MDTFPRRYKLLNLTQEDMKIINNYMSIKEYELITKYIYI